MNIALLIAEVSSDTVIMGGVGAFLAIIMGLVGVLVVARGKLVVVALHGVGPVAGGPTAVEVGQVGPGVAAARGAAPVGGAGLVDRLGRPAE